MRKSISPGFWIAAFILLSLSACIPATPTPATQAPEEIYTSVAQTVLARLTQSAGETAVAMLTSLASSPSNTPAPAEPVQSSPTPIPPSSTPTAAPPVSSTPTPTALASSVLCDWAQWVGDVSVVDNTTFAPGASFNKTWRLKNIGSCTWTPAYSLIFAGGDLMGASPAIPLPGYVNPGQMIELSLDMVAPTTPGAYHSNWMLRNPSGVPFGVDTGATGSFWVQIQVAAFHQMGDYAYDFAANYCSAQWSSGSASLGCPGSSSSPDGSAVLLDQPDLETFVEDEMTLWTRPNSSRNGWISGKYPPYRIYSGDRFIAGVGCMNDSPGCDVTFEVTLELSNGQVRKLGSWEETYDGETTEVDIDLSNYAGRVVQFSLEVYNNGRPADANAFWLVPHIESEVQPSELILNWHQEGSPGSTCNELRVTRTGRRSGEARGFSCQNNSRDLGTVQLTEDEISQFLDLVNRLKSFDGEVYSASPSGPLVTWMSFVGQGTAEASNSDILTLQNLGSQIFNAIKR